MKTGGRRKEEVEVGGRRRRCSSIVIYLEVGKGNKTENEK